jgi:hypothetical protein
VDMAEDPLEQHNLIAEYATLARHVEERAALEMQRRGDAIAEGLKQLEFNSRARR